MIPIPIDHLLLLPDPTSKVVAMEIAAPLPKLTRMELADVQVLGQLIAHENAQYTRGKMRFIVAGATDDVHFDVTEDHLRLSLSVPKSDETIGLSLLTALLTEPLISDATVAEAKQSLVQARQSAWQIVLAPQAGNIQKVRASEVLRLYHTVLRPDRIFIGLGGNVDASTEKKLRDRLADWTQPKAERPSLTAPSGPAPDTIHPPVQVLRGPAITASHPAFSAHVLAAFALGIGKGASVFRVWREAHAWSYLQECEISGSQDGFHLLTWLSPNEELKPADLGKALADDIAQWTESDRQRAVGMAESVLLRGLDLSPFCFSSRGRLSDSLADRTFLGVYWRMKTGSDWNSRGILESLKKVTLEELKQAALAELP